MKFGNFNLNVIKETHELILSGSSAKIKFSDGETMHLSNGFFTKKELSFIKSVKEEIIKNSTEMRLSEHVSKYRKKITYFNIAFGKIEATLQRGVSYDVEYMDSEKEVLMFTEVQEIDINAAYWCAAFQTGLISERTYKRGMESESISKKARLAAVGASATCYTSFFYDADFGDYEMTGVRQSSDGMAAFYHIARFVSDVMSEIFSRGLCYLFWVDAVFCPSGYAADEARRTLKTWGFDHKTIPVDSLKYEKNEYEICVTAKKTGKNGEKIEKKYRKSLKKIPKKAVILSKIEKREGMSLLKNYIKENNL